MKNKLKTYKVEIQLSCEWVGESEEDVRKQIDEEWGGFEDIENDISIEEVSSKLNKEKVNDKSN